MHVCITRKAFKFVVVTGKAARQSVHKLRRWKYPAFAICFFILFFSSILPFSTLVLMSLTSFFTAVEGRVILEFTLPQNFVDALSLPLLFQALVNTIAMALVAGFFSSLIAAFMSYAALKSRVKGARLIEYITTIPLAFPESSTG